MQLDPPLQTKRALNGLKVAIGALDALCFEHLLVWLSQYMEAQIQLSRD